MTRERTALKDSYTELKALHEKMNAQKVAYVKSLDEGDPGLYITTHAIVRYIERIKGIPLMGKDDAEKAKNYLGKFSDLREEMLDEKEGHEIILNHRRFYPRKGYTLVVDGLTLLTVTKD